MNCRDCNLDITNAFQTIYYKPINENTDKLVPNYSLCYICSKIKTLNEFINENYISTSLLTDCVIYNERKKYPRGTLRDEIIKYYNTYEKQLDQAYECVNKFDQYVPKIIAKIRSFNLTERSYSGISDNLIVRTCCMAGRFLVTLTNTKNTNHFTVITAEDYLKDETKDVNAGVQGITGKISEILTLIHKFLEEDIALIEDDKISIF